MATVRPSSYSIQPPRRFSDKAYNQIPYLMEESLEMPIREEDAAMLELISNRLPCQGLLKQSSNNCIYLDLDDNFIQMLFPLISDKTKQSPTSMSYSQA